MTNEEKALENLATIAQILDISKMNPDFNQLDRIYKLAKMEKNDENN